MAEKKQEKYVEDSPIGVPRADILTFLIFPDFHIRSCDILLTCF